MGGVTNIRAALTAVLAQQPTPRVLGLCDEGEVDVVVRAVSAAGYRRTPPPTSPPSGSTPAAATSRTS